ncbi:MAG TPA: acetyltransferase [Phycisphaerae bacterium]|nr:acetyltransferase [Phycisphaerae bacterium]
MLKDRENDRQSCVIVGAGGHGRVVLDILLSAHQYQVVGFLDSNPSLHGRRMDGVPILGDLNALPDLRAQGVTRAVVAIGDNGVRRSFAQQIEQAGFELINAIHPSANLARTVSLGRNVVVAAGALVCAHCQIGDSVILNTGCIIDHESMIGTAVHICPGAKLAGRVTVEAGAHIGIGATVLQVLRIGCEAVIGGGAVVIDDVEPMTTVVGVPARPVSAPAPDDELPGNLLPLFKRAGVRHHAPVV